MDSSEFLRLMNFPGDWLTLGMYPDELSVVQSNGYVPGHEKASEHDRNGAFHWWLKREPTKEQLIKLVALTWLDPDQHMAEDIRVQIGKAKRCDDEVMRLLSQA
ncbi:MAG TPA: hypothetical protein VIF60_07040 [Burkholderiaceae bacterium]